MKSEGLQDRYFNENDIFYDIRVRNKKLVDSVQQKKSGTPITTELAESIKEETKVKAEAEDIIEDKPAEENKDTSQDQILRIYDACKAKNPDLSFKDFCLMVATGEVGLYLEEVDHEKK